MNRKFALGAVMAASMVAGACLYSTVGELTNRTCLNAEAASSTTSSGWKFNYYEDYCEITGCTDDVQGDVAIPAVIAVDGKDLPVTKVNNNFFYSGKYITGLTVPASITTLPNQFCEGKKNLKSVTFEGKLIVLPGSCFENCSSLETVKLPEGLVEIGSEAFMGCTRLASIQIPNTVSTLGTYVFSGCEALKKVTIPGSIPSLSERTFSGCTSLESVTIENGVKTISSGAFNGCTSLKEITFPKSVTSITSSLIFTGCSNLESITIENPDCALGNISGTETKPLTIYGYEGSTAEKYCKDAYHHCEFKTLGEKPVKPAVPDTGDFCDADGDGEISVADAQMVLIYAVEKIAGNTPSWYDITGNAKAPDAP